MSPVESRPNAFNGVDYWTSNGVLRTSREDDTEIMYVFDTHMNLRWKAEFSPSTPESVRMSCWMTALRTIC